MLEHYKELVPNLRYIEGNEWNLSIFGGLTAFESYELYKRMYQVANRLNRKHQYEIPLEVGGPAYGVCLAEFKYYEEFLRLYKLDKNPEKMLAFYSTHDYKKNMTELPGYYYKHQELVRELGLPNSPIFFDEYGAAELFTPEISDNQMNAAVSIEMLLTVAWLENFYVFPWCTYHDPSLQVSHCMFVDFNRTCGYLPTFYGQAHIALSKLLGNVLPMTGNTGNRAVVTTDGENYVILATNPDDKPHNIRFALTNLPGTTVKVEAYKVDAMHNNCFIDKSVTDLQITDSWEASLEDGKLMVYDTLDALGFTLWIIKK